MKSKWFGLMAWVVSIASMGQAQTVIADYQMEFNSRRPAVGWAYYWNPTGSAVGTADAYSELVNGDGNWQTFINTAERADAAHVQNMNAKRQHTRLYIVGASAAKNSTDGLDHYAIAAYTIQPGEAGQIALVDESKTWIKDRSTVKVFVGDVEKFSKTGSGDLGPLKVELGALRAGETVYFAVSSEGTGNASFLFTKYQLIRLDE